MKYRTVHTDFHGLYGGRRVLILEELEPIQGWLEIGVPRATSVCRARSLFLEKWGRGPRKA